MPSSNVTISGSALTNPDPNNAIQIQTVSNNNYRGRIVPYKGYTVHWPTMEKESYYLVDRGLPQNLGGRISADGRWLFIIYAPTGSVTGDTATNPWFSLQYVSSADAFAFTYYGKDQSSVPTDTTRVMQLYRVYTQGIELYKAIKSVRGYADGNADGRFPSDLYATFTAYLESCISDYNANNKKVTNEATLKTTLDAKAKQLLAYADDLTANITDMNSYIDIPIEILDFRTNGLTVEWQNSNVNYNLRKAPGTTFSTTLGEADTVRQGLTEEYLVGGQMVYTESTIKYVAEELLAKKSRVNWDDAVSGWEYSVKISGWDDAFYDKLDDTTMTLGSFSETLKKTDTGKNGGHLTWSQVTTYYDMAYYIYNYLWRPVKEGDYTDTDNSLGYNMVVPERKRLRLFKDEETGLYTLDSAYRMIYNGYYCYNASELYPTDDMYDKAFFSPVDNLGFESPQYDSILGFDTDQGYYLSRYQLDAEETNYHFSMHAEGSFVYYRDQNLYFEFIGDDDVYFYINGRRAMDLGASHRATGDVLELNSIADEFGLEDGGVYSFDMFYIERHTTASNLKFSTNIKIVETETMTTKGMYLEKSNGTSKVNATTGMGEALADNALLRDGDIVAYSFNIANSRNVPVYNVSFSDATLGASLAYGAVSLCDKDKTGGVETSIGNIKVYYRTIDSEGNINSANPTTKTFDQIKSMINSANSAKTGLAAGNYMVSPGSVTNLQNLLKLGIPRNCQMIIYGFKRKAQSSVPSYENTLSSICYYNLSGTATTTSGVEEIPIKGTATRTYKVTASPPTSEKLEIVLDYGKAVEIPAVDIANNIKTDELTRVTGFAGLVASGSHEQVLTYISSANLMCAKNGESYAGKQGTFTRTAKGLTYQPTRFMDVVEKVYLAYNITATNSEYKYMLVELRILPATSVYYETDFAANAISTADGSDIFADDSIFFVDFNNSEADRQRYQNPIYGGVNYDDPKNINWFKSSKTSNGAAIDLAMDNTKGELVLTHKEGVTSLWTETSTPTATAVINPLKLNTENIEVYEIRFKMENFQASGGNPYVDIHLWSREEDGSISTTKPNAPNNSITTEQLTSGTYVTVTKSMGTALKDFYQLSNIRVYFNNIQSISKTQVGKITIDYIYMGPADSAPSKNPLYFDFTNSGSDQNRYSTHNYKGQNFDDASAWSSTDMGKISGFALDSATDTLKVTAKALPDSAYPDLTIKPNLPLSFQPKNAEVFQVRFKLDGFERGVYTKDGVVTTPNTYIRMRYKADGGTSWLDGTTAVAYNAAYLTNGQYITMQVNLSSGFKSAKEITDFYFYIAGLESPSGSTSAVLTIDYFYIGTKADAPAGDYLYFDFTNYPADQARYAKEPAYGGYNFDDDYHWTGKWDSGGNHSDAIVDNSKGTMTSSYGNSTEVYFYTTYNGKYSTKTLKYDPANAEVWEVRFKINTDISGSANVRLNYAADGAADILYTEKKPTFQYKTANQYITIQSELTSTFKAKSEILGLRLNFNGIPAGAEVTIDYIFIGAKADIEKVRAKYNTWQTMTDSVPADEYQDQEFLYANGEEMITSTLEAIGAGPKITSEYMGLRNGKSNYLNNIPLSFSHRGSFRNTSENSYLSVMDSLNQGIDGVELDLMITKDKVVVLSHDTTLKRVTGDNVTIANVNWSDIRDYPLEVGNGTGDSQDYTLTAAEATFLNSIPNYSTYYGEAATSGGKHYVARLDAILAMAKAKAPNAIFTFDKVDKGETVFAYTYKAAYDAGMLDRVFFKLTQNVETLKSWAATAASVSGTTQANVLNTMQMLWVTGVPNASKLTTLKDYISNGIKVVAVEGTWGSALSQANENYIINTFMPYCRANNIDFWPSTIGPNWAGGMDDDETTWLYYFEKLGVDGLMVDRPEEFAVFMHYYNGASRTTSELLEAEHFQNYNIGSAKFFMKEAADANNNKLVNEMQDGDYLEYRKINFTGSESTLYVTAKGFNGGGALKFYVDSMDDSNLFATISFGNSEYCVTRTTQLIKSVSKGSHTVYVKAFGNVNRALLSFDSFTFQKQSDDHYLYFDFNNTAEDQTRYKKAIYGSSYNFDTKNYWATYASDDSSDSVNKTNFTIDNANGVATIKVGDTFEGEKIYCGPKFMTTKTYGVFPYTNQGANAPLRYVPSANDYLVVRFKLDNVIAGSDYTPKIFMEYHWNNASGTDNMKYEDIKADYRLELGKWQTVIAPVSSTFKNAAQITSLGLRFTGILSPSASSVGTVTIDYIYVGPLQHKDRLRIDFEGGYEDSVYGGKNYDISSEWKASGTGRNSAPVVANGTVSTTTTGSSGANYYHIKMSNANMTYYPGDDDYCEVRFKISNATADGTNTNLKVLMYYSPDLYGAAGTGDSNNSSALIPFSEVSDGEYHTVRIPMTSTYYRDAGVIRSLALMFQYLSKETVMTITVDYIYLGPLDESPSYTEDDTLFFDFTDTPADRSRYSAPQYGGYTDYDAEVEANWASYATVSDGVNNQRSFAIDNESGTLTLAVSSSTEGEKLYGPKIQTTKSFGYYPYNNADRHGYAPLHYKPTGKEYLQVRFKIEDCETSGDVKFQLDYHYSPIDSNYMKYAGLDKKYTFTEGQWQTLTYSLAGVTSFQNAEEILSIGLRFVGIKSRDESNKGRVVIDYIYVGPQETLPTMDLETYGYDSSYTNDAKLSNGSSMFVNGLGVPTLFANKVVNYVGTESYTEASFNFTGTGFDIISRTGANQGMIRVVVIDSDGRTAKMASVINKSELGTELYQIPVISIEGLAHGTYTAKIFVGAKYDFGGNDNADEYGGALDRGGEFYFDAIRIYNPINTASSTDDAKIAYELYQKHGEADAVIQEVRNKLITANSYTAGGSMSGAVYLDAAGATALANYKEVGPNNEVYLAAGKAIAFKLEVQGIIPASVDIGAKSADGKTVKLVTSVTTSAPTALPSGTGIEIASATAQYYPLSILPSQWTTSSGKSFVYISIKNNASSGILSITDVKVAYDCANPNAVVTKAVNFVVDRELLEALQVCTDHEFSYTDCGEVHRLTCALCGYSYDDPHSYTDGFCACGAEEPAAEVVPYDENLTFEMNISIGAEMQVVYTIMNNTVSEYDNFWLEVRKTVVDDVDLVNSYGSEEGMIALQQLAPNGSVLAYRATYTDIGAKNIGDEFTATLYAVKKDGTVCYGAAKSTSIKSYLMGKIADEASSAELKTLAVDMLNYGAAAQVNFDYDAENLVNADLTDAQKALGTQLQAEATDMQTITGNGASIIASVSVQNKVFMYLTVRYAATDASKVKFVIKSAADGTVIAELPATAMGGGKAFQGSYDGVGAKQMREPITIEMQEDGKTVSQILTWSVESYVAQTRANASTTVELLNMVNALLAYGDSAAAYLAK